MPIAASCENKGVSLQSPLTQHIKCACHGGCIHQSIDAERAGLFNLIWRRIRTHTPQSTCYLILAKQICCSKGKESLLEIYRKRGYWRPAHWIRSKETFAFFKYTFDSLNIFIFCMTCITHQILTWYSISNHCFNMKPQDMVKYREII